MTIKTNMTDLDPNTLFGEWLCSLTTSPISKSIIRANIGSAYQQDYAIVTNLCNGVGFIAEIPQKMVDRAIEYYKQFLKAQLEMSPFAYL